MESSTPPAPSSNEETIAQDPLAQSPSETSGLYSNTDASHQDHQNELCANIATSLVASSALSSQSNSCSDKETNSLNDNSINNGVYPGNDPVNIMKHDEHHQMNDDRRLQYEANQIANNYANSDQQKNNHMNMQHQHLHEPHKSFSHSIENLSKTTEKCAPNDIKIFPNLIDGHDQYDDGYETGVGDLLAHNKYKLPSLPPPSSSPYSSLSSSSMSTISTATTTPTNLVNPQQQQQSPSYMGNGNAGNSMNQYQQQQQQQQQYHQNHQQYQSMHNQIPPSHQNSFNYHHMFGRMPQQMPGAIIKSEPSMTSTDNDPYRFVDDEFSNGMSNAGSGGMHNSMHSLHQQQHMSPAGMSGNYSASSSPMPPQMQQQMGQQTGNPSMMQYNDHMPPHHHHLHGHQMNHQQAQNQLMNSHMMNGNMPPNGVGHAGMNPMMMNDAPKKRGRKKKLRDENGNPVEDRPIKERKKHDRFNGMPEDEVTKRTLPDHLISNLDIVIVGINPGLFAAYKGHHYAGPGNHFWKCLYLSGLTSVQMTAEEDYKLVQYGIGFTNMVQRPTKGSADLTRKEIKEGSKVLLEKIRKFQPKIAVFNGKLIFEVFSGKKDFCFGKQPEPVEGTNTYMWVMPSSSARCAQLPRAADKVPFYAALKKFRDYLNGLVPDYDESEYVFNDPKYSQISAEAELKEDNIAFTALEGEVVMAAVDSSKKKRGRPKKVRGENGEEIAPPSRRQKENQDMGDDDPSKKKRGRPKKNKDGTTNTTTPSKKKANSSTKNNSNNNNNNNNNSNSSSNQMVAPEISSPQQLHITPPSSVPPAGMDMSNIVAHHQSQVIPQHSSLLNNGMNGSNRTFLPPMESPSSNSYGAMNQANNINNSNNNMQQSSHQTSQNASPVNLCFPPTNLQEQQHQQQLELSPHHQQTYQRQHTPSSQQMFGANISSPEISSDISATLTSEHMNSPTAASPSLAQSDFEPPQVVVANGRNSNDMNPFTQSSLEQQQQLQTHSAHHSPLSQTQSPLGMVGMYAQQQQQMTHMVTNATNGSAYSPYPRHHQQQQIQQQTYMNHQQSPHHAQHTPPNNVHNKQINQQQQINGGTAVIDPYKDVATKSLSGLESLVDQIPNINEQDSGLGSLTHSTGTQNGNNLDIMSSSSPKLMEAVTALTAEQQLNDPFSNIFSGYSQSGTSTAPNLSANSSAVASSSLALPSLGPHPHHHPHYPYSSHAAAAAVASQSPYSANPFSVSSLTSSTYPSAAAAAMNSYHQNLMGTSHLTSSFMEPPHMPVPVSPLYHSYQQQGYPGYGPPHHPSALHMSNYPYYTNSGYTQAPGSSYHHSMFDRINF